MAASTLLTHTGENCRGSVFLDPGQSAKLLSPSFSFGTSGISTMILELKLKPGGVALWECAKCGKQISGEQIKTELSAYCQICGHLHKVDDLVIHERISCICRLCVGKIKAYRKKPESIQDSRIRDYAEMFNLGERAKFIPMFDCLQQPMDLSYERR